MTARLVPGLVRSSLTRAAAPAAQTLAPPRRRRRPNPPQRPVHPVLPSPPVHPIPPSPACMLCKPASPAPDPSDPVVPVPTARPDHMPGPASCAKRNPLFPAPVSAERPTAVASGMAVAVLDQDVSTDTEFMDFETDAPEAGAQNRSVSADSASQSIASTVSTSSSADDAQSRADDCMPAENDCDQNRVDIHSGQYRSRRRAHQKHSSQPPSSRVVASSPSKDAFPDGPALSTSTVTSSDASSSLTESSPPAKATDDPNSIPAPATSLLFRSAVVCIPHPEKADKGGEDAFFVHNHALGVFDGVGGWASIGIDAGLYSKELARLTANYVANEGPAAVVDALKSATGNNRAIGSSTACVVGMDGTQLVGINVGDSGLVVIRDAAIVYRTTEQQHYFNCPFQIGTDSLDTVEVGGPIDVPLQHGDWIIMGTDGLWDNVFSSTIVEIVTSNQSAPEAADKSASSKQSGVTDSASDGGSAASDCSASSGVAEDAQAIAQKLAEFAVKVANDERGTSPFAVNAQNAGHLFLGGKVDDITIIAALVIDPDYDGCSVKSGLEEVHSVGAVSGQD